MGISETRDRQTQGETINDVYWYVISEFPSGKHGVGTKLKMEIRENVQHLEFVNNWITRLSIQAKNQKTSILQVSAQQQGQPSVENMLIQSDEQMTVMRDFKGMYLRKGQDVRMALDILIVATGVKKEGTYYKYVCKII